MWHRHRAIGVLGRCDDAELLSDHPSPLCNFVPSNLTELLSVVDFWKPGYGLCEVWKQQQV